MRAQKKRQPASHLPFPFLSPSRPDPQSGSGREGDLLLVRREEDMAVISRLSLLVMAIVVVLATVANAQLAPAPAPTSDGDYLFSYIISLYLFSCAVIFEQCSFWPESMLIMWDGRKLQCSFWKA